MVEKCRTASLRHLTPTPTTLPYETSDATVEDELENCHENRHVCPNATRDHIRGPTTLGSHSSSPHEHLLRLQWDNLATLDSGTTPPTLTPPQKAAKRSREDRQPRDVDHSERESPAHRYKNKGVRPAASLHPLSLTTGRSLVGDDYDPADDEYSPIEDHPFFRPNSPSPAPSASSAPHRPPSPSPSTTGHSPSPSPAPSRSTRSPSSSATAPPPSPSAAAVTPQQSPTPTLTALPDDDDPMDVENTGDEARTAYLAAESACSAENPHRPSPMHDPANTQAMPQHNGIQANDAAWPSPIIPDHVALQGVSAKLLAAIAANPKDFLAATLFCYGTDLAEKHKNVHSEVLARLEEVVGKGKLTLLHPRPEDAAASTPNRRSGRADKFGPPIAWIIRCKDAEARKLLTDQATFGCTPTIGFHVTIFDAKCLSWCAGFWATDVTDVPAVAGRRLCWAVREGIRTSPILFSLFDRMTQGGNTRSRDQRLIDFGATFEARYLPHDDGPRSSPVYLLFAKPCTEDAKLWDDFRHALRQTWTDDLEAFRPRGNAGTGHNICADCKLDCHPRFNCPFTFRDKSWWGPRGLVQALKDLRGGGDEDDDEGDRRGAPRGRGAFRGFTARMRGRQ
ncbi:hypothetical protein C8R44DRAFT_885511 [Mycena epipterygia]|nr:hypothetical protein C8R44DRAFT_885511 [Mycena epipterygia]